MKSQDPQNIKGKIKKTMKTNSNTTSQTKWQRFALDAIKTHKQAQTNHKIPKAQKS